MSSGFCGSTNVANLHRRYSLKFNSANSSIAKKSKQVKISHQFMHAVLKL